VARSNWAGIPIGVDVNNPPLTTSQDQGGHRININAAVPITLGAGLTSRHPVRAAQRGPVNVVNGTFDQLMHFIDNDCSLSPFKGQIATHNTCTSPWFHEVDFRYAVNIPTGNKVRVDMTMDIFNLLNLLNKDWGGSTTRTSIAPP
jgi:hypothetical protein